MKNKCEKCGHEWIPRIDVPRCCPNCKQYDWKLKGKLRPAKQGKASKSKKEKK